LAFAPLTPSGSPYSTIPTQFASLLDLTAKNPDGFRDFIPEFAFRLIRLAEIPFDQIQGANAGIMVLRTLKASQLRLLLGPDFWDEAHLSLLPDDLFRALLPYILNAACRRNVISKQSARGVGSLLLRVSSRRSLRS
jgi:hypothetical protein